MGTKTKPGRFDCYKKAAPNEPLFTMIGRDHLAPHLVCIWAYVRIGELHEARRAFERMLFDCGGRYLVQPDRAKAEEAFSCAGEMQKFYDDLYGRREYRVPVAKRCCEKMNHGIDGKCTNCGAKI